MTPSTVVIVFFSQVDRDLLLNFLVILTVIIESDDLKAVLNEMDKAFNYSQKVSLSSVFLCLPLNISLKMLEDRLLTNSLLY